MKFQIENVTTINNKVYLLTRCLTPGIQFKLSDQSFLGDIEIENWFDIPRALDNNGDQRTDIFAFVLKNNIDIKKIKEEQVFELRVTNNISKK